jgi:hypothetical protein
MASSPFNLNPGAVKTHKKSSSLVKSLHKSKLLIYQEINPEGIGTIALIAGCRVSSGPVPPPLLIRVLFDLL